MSGAGDDNGRLGTGGPDGVPLGRAFLIGPGLANEPLREAIAVVERVHGDGELPVIPIVWDSTLDVDARFIIRDGRPSAITVRPGVRSPIPIIHEVGHQLDFSAIDGSGKFASTTSAGFARWRALVDRTDSFRSLSEAVSEALAQTSSLSRDRRRRIARLRDPEEVWARCYTQVRRGTDDRIAA